MDEVRSRALNEYKRAIREKDIASICTIQAIYPDIDVPEDERKIKYAIASIIRTHLDSRSTVSGFTKADLLNWLDNINEANEAAILKGVVKILTGKENFKEALQVSIEKIEEARNKASNPNEIDNYDLLEVACRKILLD